MQIWLVISPEVLGSAHLANVLDVHRRALPSARVLFPRSPGKRNHTRLQLAVLDPGHRLHLRRLRGLAQQNGPATLRQAVIAELGREVRTAQPEKLILVAGQLFSSLNTQTELERLRDLLIEFSRDIRLVLHVDEPARVLIRHYADAVQRGRTAGLDRELALAESGKWFQPALAEAQTLSQPGGPIDELDLPPHWLDFAGGIAFWENIFGLGSIQLADGSTPARAVDSALEIMGLSLPEVPQPEVWPQFGDEWLARNRAINALFSRITTAGMSVDRRALQAAQGHAAVDGPDVDSGSLGPVSDLLLREQDVLAARRPDLAHILVPSLRLPDWTDPPLTEGFRPIQFVGAVVSALDSRNAEAEAKKIALADLGGTDGETKTKFELPYEAQKFAERMAGSRFAPHNGLIREDPAKEAIPFKDNVTPAPDGRRVLAIACMKNEGPFILEWLAFHRAIGISDFLIYTNDCDDGTDELLDALAEHGLLSHRLNDDWKGKSPQKAALNKSPKEELFLAADWIVHFDVDEFINIKTGNGTIHDLMAMAPGAGAFTLTWRTFGHNSVLDYKDEPVISQFTAASPSYCPKPHTAWGFKTLFKNVGAYDKLFCHRPNQLNPDIADEMVWVNGSGVILPAAMREKGWRSDVGTIGYDLVQLNHYPLRSAESFLVKRKRGRALHVTRSIGRNYWIRNDWNDFRDNSVLRNLPRLQAELARLRALDGIAALHDACVRNHREKIAELRADPAFEDLLNDVMKIKLTAIERAAYTMMLDVSDNES